MYLSLAMILLDVLLSLLQIDFIAFELRYIENAGESVILTDNEIECDE